MPLQELLAHTMVVITGAFALVVAWRLPSLLKLVRPVARWLASTFWKTVLEPKYRLAHSYYLRSLLGSPMQELGPSVKYRLLVPSMVRPELRDNFGRDISTSALLSVVAKPTVKTIHFRIEIRIGALRTQDTFDVHTNFRTCELQFVRPNYPCEDFGLFTSNPLVSTKISIVANIVHANHVEHAQTELTPTHTEFFNGDAVSRNGAWYNVTAFARAKEEIAERILEALLTPDEVALSTRRENVRELRRLIRRGKSLRWDTPLRRAIATLLTVRQALGAIFWFEMFRGGIDFTGRSPIPRISWLAAFRCFRIDGVRSPVISP